MLGIHKAARNSGLALPAAFAWLFAVLLAWGSTVWAESPYLPDHALVPTITNNLGPSGAFGLPPLNPPDPPKNFDKEASWNMKVVGFMDQLVGPATHARDRPRRTIRTAPDIRLRASGPERSR